MYESDINTLFITFENFLKMLANGAHVNSEELGHAPLWQPERLIGEEDLDLGNAIR